MYAYTYVCLLTDMPDVCMCACLHVCIDIHLKECKYIFMQMNMLEYVCVDIHVYICMYITVLC